MGWINIDTLRDSVIRWSIGTAIAIEIVSNTIFHRIADFVLLYVDEIGRILTLFSVFNDSFNFVFGNIEHVLVFFIFAAATNSLASRAKYHPNFKGSWFWMAALAHWLIFEYTIILLGKPAPYWDMLSRDSQILASFILYLAPLVILLIPLFAGVFESIEDELIIEVSDVDFREYLTQIFVLSGAMAIIFQIGIFVELLVILGLFFKLIFPRFGWDIQLEKSTINLISGLDKGPSGFATIFVILVGVYMSSEAVGILINISPVLWLIKTQPQLMIKYIQHFIPVIGIIILAAMGVILWVNHFPNWHRVNRYQKHWAGITALAIEGAIIEISRATLVGEKLQFSLSSPVTFGFLIALIVVISIQEYAVKDRWITSAGFIIVALGILGPIMYNASLAENYPIVAYPALSYGLTPIVQLFGLVIGKYTFRNV